MRHLIYISIALFLIVSIATEEKHTITKQNATVEYLGEGIYGKYEKGKLTIVFKNGKIYNYGKD